jgi:hypothetical protein
MLIFNQRHVRGTRDLHPALQRPTTPPSPRPSPTATDPPRGGPEPETDHTSPRSWRLDQRVRTSGIKLLLSLGDRLLEPHTVRRPHPPWRPSLPVTRPGNRLVLIGTITMMR